MNETTNKTTPGPWIREGDLIKGNGGLNHVALVYDYRDERSLTEANADLIAAAPDFYEVAVGDEEMPHYGALAALLTDWSRLYNAEADDDPTATAEGIAELRVMLDGLRKAHAKATGQAVAS